MIGLVEIAFVVVVAASLVVCALTLGISLVRYYWIDRRRRRIQRELTPQLFDRLVCDDPEWQPWCRSLSWEQRLVLREQVATYLRVLGGSDHGRLRELAAALAVDARSLRALQSRSLSRRLRALVWLSLLKYRVPTAQLQATAGADSRTRAMAARVVYEASRREPEPTDAVDGTQLLLWKGREPLSIFGLDTLYRLTSADATPLLERADAESSHWAPSLLVQVLTVLKHCQAGGKPAQLEWVYPLLDHESTRVRAAALAMFSRHGWRPSVRERIDVERAMADDSPAVRIAAYELLSSWRDRSSIELLEYGLAFDPDVRSRLIAARLLENTAGTAALPAVPDDPAVEWVRAERRLPTEVTSAWL